MPYCIECGAEHDASADFCPSCGSAIGEHTQGKQSEANNRSGEVSDADGGGRLITRRRALLGGGVVGGVLVGGFVLGELGGGPQHQLNGEGWDVTTSSGGRSESLTGAVTLPGGNYAVRELNPAVGVDVRIDFDVPSGQPVDILTMNQTNYSDYREAADNIQFNAGLSATGSTGDILTGGIGAGDYRFIVDNTGVYGATPDGEVRVDVELTASV